MSGTIRTYQKCPACGAKFPSSKGGFPIVCKTGCMTQPTKYFISVKWLGISEQLFHDRDGRTVHDWGHAVSVLGEIRSRMASHKAGKGFFDPSAYKKQSSTSFGSFWGRFEGRYKDATKEKIQAIGRHHVTHFSGFQMRDIVPWHVDEWWQNLAEKGLSERYKGDILTWVRAFFKYAAKLNVIEKIPAILEDLHVDIPEPEVEDWFTEGIQLAILGALPEYDRPIYDFLFLTGCRVGEACGLKRSDIRLDIGKVIISNTVKRNGEIGIVKNKKRRPIPYEGEIKACIVSALQRTGIGNEFIFVNKFGRRYSDDYLRAILYKACDTVGVKRIKLKNATRHSFGMALLRKGYDRREVADVMNITNGKVINHYVKMLDEDISGAYGRGCENGEKKKTNRCK